MLWPMNRYTVESVTSGHPDKICDQISDAILDELLRQDPDSRAGIEIMGSHRFLVIGGEVRTRGVVAYDKLARDFYTTVGYPDSLKIVWHVAEQSPDISRGVDVGGAGDQGIMYGYATDETPEFLSLGVARAHRLVKELEKKRKSGEIDWLAPDGKSQITVENGKFKTVLVSAQHKEGISQEEIKKVLIEKIIAPVMGDLSGIEVLINPTGKFVYGGFEADAGMTGRKQMVDTYGGIVPHGGGCFSGKDPSKVDRSAAYMSRFVAKNLVANGYAKKALVSVAYAIGKAEPLMVEAIDEKGQSLRVKVIDNFDFRPSAIIERLDLKRPIYTPTASYGHFGRKEFPWEKIVTI